MQFISLGGWCGTRIALDQAKITDKEPHNVFDHIRSSSKGILECLKNNFSLSSLMPESLVIDSRFRNFRPFIGEHFGFYSHDLTKREVLSSIERKIARFTSYCMDKDKNTVFIRTCTIPDYKEELDDMIELQKVLVDKYPTLKFIIVFVIPDQDVTAYYETINNNKLFVFTLNDKSYNNHRLGEEYRNIFDFILNNNLFSESLTLTKSNVKNKISPISTRLCLVENLPAVIYNSKIADSLK